MANQKTKLTPEVVRAIKTFAERQKLDNPWCEGVQNTMLERHTTAIQLIVKEQSRPNQS